MDAIRQRRLFASGDRVAVAVSGGLDSVCLLHLLVQTADLHGAELVVAHLDHGTREDSGQDCAFVRDLSERLGLVCVAERRALGPAASEAECRQARLAFYDSLAVERVATGHHQDDQAETLLLHLMRGAGTRGLSGMAWRRGRIVRPLLEFSRAELSNLAAQQGWTWREDPTNLHTRFLRNRIRHEVLPLLEDLRSGSGAALARGAAVAAQDDRCLTDLAKGLPEAEQSDWACEWVYEAPEALVARVLAQRVEGLTHAHVKAVREVAQRGRGRVALPNQVEAHVVNGRMRLKRGAGRDDSGG